MAAPRPTTIPTWTDGDAAKVTEPSLGKRDIGYVTGEKPSPFEMNWLFWLLGDWVAYLDENTGTASLITYANEEIGIGGIVDSDVSTLEQIRRISGLGGPILASSTPFGTGGTWIDGLRIVLQGTHDTNTVKIVHNDNDNGCILNGDWTSFNHKKLFLRWDSIAIRWIEDAARN